MPPRGVKPGSKRARQYEHIKDSGRQRGMSNERAEEMASRTVNKERSEAGERTRGGKKTGGNRKSSSGSRKTTARTAARKSTSRTPGATRTSSARKGSRAASTAKRSAKSTSRKTASRKTTGTRKTSATRKSSATRKTAPRATPRSPGPKPSPRGRQGGGGTASPLTADRFRSGAAATGADEQLADLDEELLGGGEGVDLEDESVIDPDDEM